MPSVHFPFEAEPSWQQWLARYPDWCHGHEGWRAQSLEGDVWIPPELPSPLETREQRVSNSQSVTPRPRVFISHRQGDEDHAERIADLADQAGFHFWLDTVNLPPPSVIAGMSAVAVALRIEMALLNCSHVVAVYTDKTPGSTWVPYEYGRVKEPVLSSTKCCTWLCVKKAHSVRPEWLELNEKRTDEPTLIDWLDDEFRQWGTSLSKPVGSWKGATTPLPSCP